MKIDTLRLQEPEKPGSFTRERPPFISGDGVVRVSSTSLEKLMTCARAGEYYLIRRREPNTTAPALTYGTAIHAALEIYYRDFGGKLTQNQMGEYVELLQKQFSSIFPPPPLGEGPDWRTPELAIQTMLSYLVTYEFLDFTPMQVNNKPLVEVPFEFLLGEVDFDATYDGKFHKTLSIMWTGKIDMIVEHDGKPCVVDHKTTSILGKGFFSEFINSAQALGYVWAARRLLGRNVNNFMVNAIASRKLSKTGKAFQAERQKYYYADSRIAEWEFNTMTIVADFCANVQRGFFPQETKWCVGKYGICPFLDVCEMSADLRETVLQSNLYRPTTTYTIPNNE